jgi:hypothetical protein
VCVWLRCVLGCAWVWRWEHEVKSSVCVRLCAHGVRQVLQLLSSAIKLFPSMTQALELHRDVMVAAGLVQLGRGGWGRGGEMFGGNTGHTLTYTHEQAHTIPCFSVFVPYVHVGGEWNWWEHAKGLHAKARLENRSGGCGGALFFFFSWMFSFCNWLLALMWPRYAWAAVYDMEVRVVPCSFPAHRTQVRGGTRVCAAPIDTPLSPHSNCPVAPLALHSLAVYWRCL